MHIKLSIVISLVDDIGISTVFILFTPNTWHQCLFVKNSYLLLINNKLLCLLEKTD